MGSLSLPSSGMVSIDAQILVYTVEHHPVYEPLLQPLWQAAQAGTLEVISSELTLMEVLVHPLKTGDATVLADYEQALLGADLILYPITPPILREAARLRATIPALRTPDALHAATARLAGAALFLTNDHGFRRVPGLPLTVLDDVLIP